MKLVPQFDNFSVHEVPPDDVARTPYKVQILGLSTIISEGRNLDEAVDIALARLSTIKTELKAYRNWRADIEAKRNEP